MKSNAFYDKKCKIYLLGTTHISKISLNRIRASVSKYKPAAIFSEGIKGGMTKKDIIKEPFLFVIIKIYFCLVKIMGRKAQTIKDVAQEYKIPQHNIDLTLSELINFFHKWYNYFISAILIGIFSSFIFSSKFSGFPFYLRLLLFIFIPCAIYFFYFIEKTMDIRNKSFVDKTKKFILQYKYETALIFCGKTHSKEIKEPLKAIDSLRD